MNTVAYVTPDGHKKLQEELEYLKKIKLFEVAKRIKEAKDQGDLSENAEYSIAKDEQATLLAKITELEDVLKRSQIIAEGRVSDSVTIGSKVTVQRNDQEFQYEIVGFSEADPSSGKISNESPLGKAFLGKKKGEETEVITPGGTMKYLILFIK